jgi:hypothetical protein
LVAGLLTGLLAGPGQAQPESAQAGLDSLVSASQSYVQSSPDSARLLAAQAQRLADATGSPVLRARALRNQGFLYYR